mmetsp:Transcript_29249/g.67343  ORF Transcript_29249/g.67343 Transcript_29249/m.67343 type:complete len:113 (-) Transcript_29249:152-490(-)
MSPYKLIVAMIAMVACSDPLFTGGLMFRRPAVMKLPAKVEVYVSKGVARKQKPEKDDEDFDFTVAQVGGASKNTFRMNKKSVISGLAESLNGAATRLGASIILSTVLFLIFK